MLKEFIKEKGPGILLSYVITAAIVVVLAYVFKTSIPGVGIGVTLLYIGDFFIEYAKYKKKHTGEDLFEGIGRKFRRK